MEEGASEGSRQVQGRVALGKGDGGSPGETGGDPPISATPDERGKQKSKVPKARLASPRLSPPLPCFREHLIISTAVAGCCITCFCFFVSSFSSLVLPCDLSTLQPTEHSIQVFLARFPFDRPFSSSIWCQRHKRGDRNRDTGESFV